MAGVMLLAGGTGGHVFPALAVACWLRDHGHGVGWMGTPGGLEARVVPAAGFELDTVSVRGLRGKGAGALLRAPGMLVRALWQALRILRHRRPGVVLGMGGFAAGPGGLAAGMLGIPLVIHEQNCVPGTTNRWLTLWARRVLEGFPGTFATRLKPCWTGNPLREELLCLPSRTPLEGRLPRLLVLGGSGGARALNVTVPRVLQGLGGRLEVWHQSGSGAPETVAGEYRRAGIAARVEAFIGNMAAAWGWTDLAVCRAGAMTVSELAAAGVPAILVPYPHAVDDHQTRNAGFLAQRGAAVLLPESRLGTGLREEVMGLLGAPERLREMARAARRVARPDATETVARICLEEIDGA